MGLLFCRLCVLNFGSVPSVWGNFFRGRYFKMPLFYVEK